LRPLVRGPVLLDLIEQLSALGSSVVDEGLNVLLKTLYRLLHLIVPGFRALEASLEIQKFLVRPFVSSDHCSSLPLE
jgi:hypothetical protein